MKYSLKLSLLVFVLLFIVTLPFPLHFIQHPAFSYEHFFIWIEQGICSVLGLEYHFQGHLYSDSPDLLVHVIFLAIGSPLLALLIQKTRKPGADALDKAYLLSFSWILGFFLIKYGFDKIFKLQFYAPEPNILYTPFGALDKDILYWSVVGKSYSYSVFSGAIELVAGCLVLFRKTRKLGALLAFGVLLHVLQINISFGIEVKILSSFLLLLSVLILFWYRRELQSFFLTANVSVPRAEAIIRLHPRWKRLLCFTLLFYIFFESTFLAFSTGNFNDDTFPRPEYHGAYEILDEATGRLEQALGLENGQEIRRVFIHRQAYLVVQTTQDEFIDFAFSYLPGKNGIRLRNSRRTEIFFRKTNKGEIQLEFASGKDKQFLRLKKLPG
ncbi:MAG: hypothetical protein ACO1O6_10355 [Bacteroidota bacterium]